MFASALLLALELHWIPREQDELYHISHSSSLSLSSQCANALMNLLLFEMRMFVTTLMDPESLVVGELLRETTFHAIIF